MGRSQRLLVPFLLVALLRHSQGQQENETAEVEEAAMKEVFSYKKKPYVSGIRVLDVDNKRGFVSYTATGVSIVYPDRAVRISVLGYHLDRIGLIAVTTASCFHPVFNISRGHFMIQTRKRLDFVAKFPESEKPFVVCYKERSFPAESSEEDDDMIMIDEMRTWVSTELPPHENILPLYVQLLIILVLFCLSALMSGLNLGLMALSPQELELIQKSGSKDERMYAETILPVRMSGNYLLCTILIMNVVVNAAIALLLEDVSDGLFAFLVSSAGIVVVGEIIPQSVCIKKGLAVGAHTIWLTRLFMIITFPISYPISRALNIFLGQDTPVYDKNRLIQLMKMTTDDEDHELHGDLKIAVGGMEIYQKTVGEILTKIEDVFMLPEDTILDAANIAEIVRHGYTRIPVYRGGDRHNIVSLLMVKDLALIDPRDNFTVKNVCEFHHYSLRFVDEEEPLHTLLEEFKEGNYHLAIVEGALKGSSLESEVSKDRTELLGIVTLEDIVEEILQAEIVDESDIITDNVYKSKRKDWKEPSFAELLSREESCQELSHQMEAQTIRFLRELHVLFTNEFVEQKALSWLLKKNIKQVDLTRSSRVDGITRHLDRVTLYTRGETSHRVIVILEGRATVEIRNMRFEVGPWNCFGTELLDQTQEVLKGIFTSNNNYIIGPNSALVTSIKFDPDFTMEVSKFCRFVQIPVTAYFNAYQVTRLARGTREGRFLQLQPKASLDVADSTRLRGFSNTHVPRAGSGNCEEGRDGDPAESTKKRSQSDYNKEKLLH